MTIFICSQYCSYYQPDKHDVGHCFPVKIAKRLALAEVPCKTTFSGSHPQMQEIFCKRCDFYPQDCDFHSVPKGLPCGGYVFFECMLQRGDISIEDITRISSTLE